MVVIVVVVLVVLALIVVVIVSVVVLSLVVLQAMRVCRQPHTPVHVTGCSQSVRVSMSGQSRSLAMLNSACQPSKSNAFFPTTKSHFKN